MAEQACPPQQMIRVYHEQRVEYGCGELDVTEMARTCEVGQAAGSTTTLAVQKHANTTRASVLTCPAYHWDLTQGHTILQHWDG